MKSGKSILLWLMLLVLLVVAYDIFQGTAETTNLSKFAFSDFLTKVDDGQVADVSIQGRVIEGHFQDGKPFSTYAPEYPDLIDKLKQNNVKIDVVPLDSKMNSV